MALPDEVGRRLRAHRKAARLSQDDVAHRLNVSRNTVVNYEAGRTEPRLSTLDELAGVYQVPVGAFFEDIPPGEFAKAAMRLLSAPARPTDLEGRVQKLEAQVAELWRDK